MLQPPAATPISRMIRIAASRIAWYSRSVRVIAGATVTESPVCVPIGSRFSIEQTITTLSAESRMTSSSNSSQPRTDSSTSTWLIGDSLSPIATWRSSCSRVDTKPPPWPPSVNAGRFAPDPPGAPRLLGGRREAAAGAAGGDRGADHRRQAHLVELGDGGDDPRVRRAQAHRLDAGAEELAILGTADHVDRRAD